jgi:peptidoglycan/LPS O-acetylase OafA/YrhL
VSVKTHITYLDSIRGLAALTVICEHYVIAYGLPCETPMCQQILDYSPLHMWWDGSAAVSMFFVLSGLVLSLKYFREGHHPDMQHFELNSYLIGRIFRIWLPYLIVLFISFALYLHIVGQSVLTTALPATKWITNMWPGNPLTAFDALRESFLLNLPSLIVLLPQSWTLNIELVLSLLLPVGLILAERGTTWLVGFTLLAVSLLDVSLFLLHFLLGLLIARHYSNIADYLTRNPWQRRLMLVIGLVLYNSASIFYNVANDSVIWLGSGLGAGLILMFASGSVRTQQILSYSWLRQMGKVSYSAYLTHMAILIGLTPYLLSGLEIFTTERTALWFGGWLLTVLVVQAVSQLSYQWLEIPSISLGRRVTDVFKRLHQA